CIAALGKVELAIVDGKIARIGGRAAGVNVGNQRQLAIGLDLPQFHSDRGEGCLRQAAMGWQRTDVRLEVQFPIAESVALRIGQADTQACRWSRQEPIGGHLPQIAFGASSCEIKRTVEYGKAVWGRSIAADLDRLPAAVELPELDPVYAIVARKIQLAIED